MDISRAKGSFGADHFLTVPVQFVRAVAPLLSKLNQLFSVILRFHDAQDSSVPFLIALQFALELTCP